MQIAIVEPGAFKTAVLNVGTNMVLVPQHPAYASPALPVRRMRDAFLKGAGVHVDSDADLGAADTAPAVARIIAFSRLPNPPMHFPLGRDSVAFAREKIGTLSAEVDEYASWSDDLGGE